MAAEPDLLFAPNNGALFSKVLPAAAPPMTAIPAADCLTKVRLVKCFDLDMSSLPGYGLL
jgi:hypothetical protein